MDEPLAYLAVKNSDIAEYISPNAASFIVSQMTANHHYDDDDDAAQCVGDDDDDAAQGVDEDDVPQGVGVALVSARLMAHTEIKYRQIGVLLFKV